MTRVESPLENAVESIRLQRYLAMATSIIDDMKKRMLEDNVPSQRRTVHDSFPGVDGQTTGKQDT